MYRMRQVWQIWQTRGGRQIVTVTKANNRKHKTKTAKTLGVESFSVGKTKPKRRPRLPPTTAVHVTVQATLRCSVVRCSESRTAHLSSIRKNRKILLQVFLWCDFSSSSNTEIVCKYHPKRIQAKGAKSSSPKVSFSRPHSTSHTSSMDPCAKVPRRPATGAIL